jgi:hypothetical protein
MVTSADIYEMACNVGDVHWSRENIKLLGFYVRNGEDEMKSQLLQNHMWFPENTRRVTKTLMCRLAPHVHCATIRTVAGSIADGLSGIFYSPNHSGRTMALGSTQSIKKRLIEISPEVKGGRCLRLTPLPSSCEECLEILTASTPWSPTGLSVPV